MVINEPHTGGKVVSRSAEASCAHVHVCTPCRKSSVAEWVTRSRGREKETGRGEEEERSSCAIVYGALEKRSEKKGTTHELYPRFLSTDLKAIVLSLSLSWTRIPMDSVYSALHLDRIDDNFIVGFWLRRSSHENQNAQYAITTLPVCSHQRRSTRERPFVLDFLWREITEKSSFQFLAFRGNFPCRFWIL